MSLSHNPWRRQRTGVCLWPVAAAIPSSPLRTYNCLILSSVPRMLLFFPLLWRVITTACWAVCLGPSSLARQEVIELVPRSLEVDREGKKSVWFLVVIASQDPVFIFSKHLLEINPLTSFSKFISDRESRRSLTNSHLEKKKCDEYVSLSHCSVPCQKDLHVVCRKGL